MLRFAVVFRLLFLQKLNGQIGTRWLRGGGKVPTSLILLGVHTQGFMMTVAFKKPKYHTKSLWIKHFIGNVPT